jgi:hypothetical protein
MPKSSIAVIAQHTANLSSLVVVVYYKFTIISADYALLCTSFKVDQSGV